MVFMIALAISIAFTVTCDKLLRKHQGLFYGLAVILAGLAVVCTYGGLTASFPVWFSRWVWPLIARDALGGALFVIVMFTGAFPNGSAPIKKLMPIRGELSIIASILTLGHNLTYGRTYFRMLFTDAGSLSLTQLIACASSIIMILIMLPLFITSFKAVRKRMNAKSWKKLQRLAYGFYGLMYLQVMMFAVPCYMRGMTEYLATILTYTGVYGTYTVMRVRKAYRKRSMAAGKRAAVLNA